MGALPDLIRSHGETVNPLIFPLGFPLDDGLPEQSSVTLRHQQLQYDVSTSREGQIPI